MTPAWVPLMSALLVIATAATHEGELIRCAEVRTSGLLVVFGSAVTASCAVRTDCPLLGGRVTNIELYLGNVTAVVANFNQSRGSVTCCVHAAPCQLVGGVVVQAGFPPVAPGRVSCQTNLTTPSTMTCSWDPGHQETLMPTQYKLGQNRSYDVPVGVQRVVLPRSDFAFYVEMTVWVTASNALGEATSDPITVEPLSSAKFPPPYLQRAVARRYGCLQLTWNLQHFMSPNKMTLEAQVRPSQTSTWTLATVRSKSVVCDLLHGTQYQVQIRTCYQGSPWSDWSESQTGFTLEKAPVGPLDYWMKIPKERKDKFLAYRLFWKPSSQFRSNGRVLSYTVSDPWGRQVCSTAASSCDLRLKTQWKKCTTTEPGCTGSGLPGSGVTDYVVEWRPLLETDSSRLLFELANRNQSSVLLTGHFEPYQPYEVSVYPRFEDAVGLPKRATFYTRQKAPSSVPDLKVRSRWLSYVELTWEELPLQERNGIISSYQLYYWDDPKHINVVACDVDNQRVVLKGLSKGTSYSVFLMVSTSGGDRNGSVITLRASAADGVDIAVLVALSFIGFSLITLIMFSTCLKYQKCSIKSWTSDMLEELSWGWDHEEPPVMHLSHLSLMDVSEKAIQRWSSSENTSDLGDSLCSSPLTPTFPEMPCGSVSYATIICTCPYAGQPANQVPTYLRSESTQPLLESENYQNMATDDDVKALEPFFFGQADGSGEEAGSDRGWEEFPMLRALALVNTPE
ncbi:hypothetical protein NHX12_000907 [Muraenolepis orangiensis]|uniref:Fibronectin type-III domain-containing protein n=1 Tax=Muraenolepis orangiensis TaxID=630683 RepID=A0A9Q0E230_9TELE|nr:hypothetical protein NHX12_000907 [Muraenolepis orangiensis]